MKDVFWITHPDAKQNDIGLYEFRRTFDAPACDKATLKISAEARYKMWLNGERVAFGPCKRCESEKYYDLVDLTGKVRPGKNEIVVHVLALNNADVAGPGAPMSVIRTGEMLLCAYLSLTEKGAEVAEILTDESWIVTRLDGTEVQPWEFTFVHEEPTDKADIEPVFVPAKKRGTIQSEDSDWYRWGGTDTKMLYRRPIPMLTQTRVPLSLDGNLVTCPYLTFGFPKFTFEGHGKIRIVYSECYGKTEEKEDRTDTSLGLHGYYDDVYVDGKTTFEAFYYRCFRYVSFQTEDDVRCVDVVFDEVNYPIEPRKDYDFGVKADNDLFEISVRTLQRCMHETFEDCPYFEQLQYTMDTSLQMLFSYQLTDDDLLSRKAMHDYASAQRANGMIPSRYPAVGAQHIPTFQLYFIFMVREHYRRFGDKALVREHLRAVDGVLEWFDHLIGEDGLVGQSKYWNFIDWVPAWENPGDVRGNGVEGGVPLAADDGPIMIYSAMMAYFLEVGAELFDVCDRHCTANEYRARAKSLKDAVNRLCFDEEKGMYADDLGHRYYSQHMQTWCTLAGIATGERADRIMKNSAHAEYKSTFAFSYFYFRALEMTGNYELSGEIMDTLRGLLKLHCTTVPEIPVHPRSECHAWGAVALYEFSAVVLGVRTLSEKERSVEIRPYVVGRDHAEGTVSTIAGNVRVSWTNKNGNFHMTVDSDSDGKKVLTAPDGRTLETTARHAEL